MKVSFILFLAVSQVLWIVAWGPGSASTVPAEWIDTGLCGTARQDVVARNIRDQEVTAEVPALKRIDPEDGSNAQDQRSAGAKR